tara:strand:+ start:8293 stop:8694 length:402 start_codon:yes stop_codon:yes gene_type:complete
MSDTFPNGVYDSQYSGTPTNLSLSLTAADTSVRLVTAGNLADGGPQLYGVAFPNAPVSLTSQYVTLSAPNEVSLVVDVAYDGANFLFVYTNREASIVPVVTGFDAGTAQQNVSAADTENTDPQLRRLWHQGMI